MACSCLFCTQSLRLKIWMINALKFYKLSVCIPLEPNHLMISKKMSSDVTWPEFMKCPSIPLTSCMFHFLNWRNKSQGVIVSPNFGIRWALKMYRQVINSLFIPNEIWTIVMMLLIARLFWLPFSLFFLSLTLWFYYLFLWKIVWVHRFTRLDIVCIVKLSWKKERNIYKNTNCKLLCNFNLAY